jgi:hypothetical protein
MGPSFTRDAERQVRLNFATMRGTNLVSWAPADEAGEVRRKHAMANIEVSASVKRPTLLVRLDAAIAEKSLLKHPFYQDWQAGKLSR